MTQYLIEIRHADEHQACVRALDAIANYGSHFMTNASWGCAVGDHAGWLIADLDDVEDARRMVPPQFREEARIIEVQHYTREKVAQLIAELEA